MKEDKCIICEADFRANVLVDGKCPICLKAHPDAKSKEDVLKKNKAVAQLMSEKRVEEIIYGILEDAGIKRIRCADCGEKFFPKSPANKYCPKCSGKPKVETKVKEDEVKAEESK